MIVEQWPGRWSYTDPDYPGHIIGISNYYTSSGMTVFYVEPFEKARTPVHYLEGYHLMDAIAFAAKMMADANATVGEPS